jgi:hypothetical protein
MGKAPGGLTTRDGIDSTFYVNSPWLYDGFDVEPALKSSAEIDRLTSDVHSRDQSFSNSLSERSSYLFMDTTPSIEQLLAQYVFNVADEYITLADSDQQARLIQLVYRLDSPTPVLESTPTLATINRPKLSFFKPTPVSLPFSQTGFTQNREEHVGNPLPPSGKASPSTTTHALTQVKQACHQHGAQLAELGDQLAQVKENLRQTQLKLAHRIAQGILIRERCNKRLAHVL